MISDILSILTYTVASRNDSNNSNKKKSTKVLSVLCFRNSQIEINRIRDSWSCICPTRIFACGNKAVFIPGDSNVCIRPGKQICAALEIYWPHSPIMDCYNKSRFRTEPIMYPFGFK